MLQRAAEQDGSRLQDRPTPGCVHEFGLCIAAPLHRRLGADAAFEFFSLSSEPVAFGVSVLFLLPEVFVPALELF